MNSLEYYLDSMLRKGLPYFCLERWQSLHENYARVNLSDSGVEPLSLHDLEMLGVDLNGMDSLSLGYGWTRGSPELREAISGLYNDVVNAESVLVTNGSAEANLTVALSLVEPGDVVLVDMPNYLQLYGVLRWLGARIKILKRRSPHWSFPIDEAVGLMRELRPKAIFVTDPNNPTGSYMSRAEAEELVREVEKLGVLLVIDEVYHGSERGTGRPSLLEIGGPESIVSISGLSKVYGLPGLRIGWAAGDPGLVERAWAAKDYTSIAPSRLGDFIASRVLGDTRVVEALHQRARSIAAKNGIALDAILGDAGLHDVIEYEPPRAGLYAFVGIHSEHSSLSVAEMLYARYSILVNPGECFGETGYLRIGLGARPEWFKSEAALLAVALAELLKGER